MKPLFLLALLLIVKVLPAQDLKSIKARIDSDVKNLSKKVYITSSTIKSKKGIFDYDISYSIRKKSVQIVIIKRTFSNGDNTTSQTFYIKDENLIFVTETSVFSYLTDSITWKGDFYFVNNKLMDYTTLGHGKSELESWDPQAELLNAFEESKQDIQDNMNGEDYGHCIQFGSSSAQEIIFYARAGIGVDSVFTHQDYLVITNYLNRTMTVDSFIRLAKNYIDTANNSDTLIGSVIFLRQEPGGCLQAPTDNYLSNINRIEKFGIIEIGFKCESPDRKGNLYDIQYINIWQNGKSGEFIYADDIKYPINRKENLSTYLDKIIDN